MTLREKVLKAAAFQERIPMNEFEERGRVKRIPRLSPLIEALAICANALERRNLNSPTGSDTAALAKLEALLKEVK